MKKTIQEQFEELLEADEQLVQVVKPDKKRSLILALVVGFAFGAIFSISGMIELINYFEKNYFCVPILQCLIIMALYLGGWALYNRNHYYAITSKRIIKRRGFFGVDYVSVEIEDIHDMFVKKLIVDKYFKNDTGTIIISHITNANEDDIEPSGDIFRLSGVAGCRELMEKLKSTSKSEQPQEEPKQQNKKK